MALSQRDIVKSLGNADVDIIIDKITKIMTKSAISAPITVIIRINGDRPSIRLGMYYYENDVLQGIVSIGDVVKRLLEKLRRKTEEPYEFKLMPSHLFLVTFGLSSTLQFYRTCFIQCFTIEWCPGRDSNFHGRNGHWHLKPARLPIPPPRAEGGKRSDTLFPLSQTIVNGDFASIFSF